MSHNHQHHHSAGGISSLRLAFFLNLSFTIIEIFGGYMTNSVAIIADAVHDLGDSLALGIAWWFQVIANRKMADDRHSYGYGRVSLLAALLNSIVLTAGSTIVIIHAYPRFLNPEPANASGMILLALLGIAVNGFAVLKTRRGTSINERVVSLHLLEDVLGWVAVLIGAIVMHFTEWNWIDPFLAILIAGFVMINISRKLWQIGRIFLQIAPEDVDMDKLRSRVESISGVSDIHHFHVWSLDGEKHVATLHVKVETPGERARIKSEIREIISEGNFEHVTIELDEEEGDCSLDETKNS